MQSADSSTARRKAVLAAVLAVQRGLISPDDAASMLGEAFNAGASTADPVATIHRVNPEASVKALTLELEQLMEQGGSALAGLGLTLQQQEALKPDAGANEARRALIELARKRISEIRGRLPLTSAERYEVQREFARGGMGRIMIATDTAVGRDVALKEVLVPRESPGSDPSDANPEAVERFLREAKVTGQLEHPNIVPVYEISRRDDGSIFYTMKLVRGRSMAERLQEIFESNSGDEAKFGERMKLLEPFTAVCHAIAYAHSRGVIHRDLKPQNIMLGSFGETVVLDWGLARVRGEDARQTVPSDTPKLSPTLMKQAGESHTLDGSVIGTPAYMPPEQARGQLELVDDKSDVYSLGAILYEILAGRPPYEGISAETIIAKVMDAQPQALAACSPLAPPDLVSLAEKAMARDRHQRIESAAALAREVAAFRDGRALSVYDYSSIELLRRFIRRNRAAVAASVTAVLMLAAVITWSVANISSERDSARDSLAQADAEKAERLALESRQKAERDGLVTQRRGEIAAKAAELAAFTPEEALSAARTTAARLEALTPEQQRIEDQNRQHVSATVAQLLDVAAARTELIRLAREPVAGRQEELIPTAELDAHDTALLAERLTAARLAAANKDFALAELILDGTRGPRADLTAARDAIEGARTSTFKHHAQRIEAILAAIRAGVEPSGSAVNAARVSDYIAEVSPWREMQTVELLSAALRRMVDIAKAQTPGTVWDVRQRLEIQFIGDVLLQVELPSVAVPPLAELMLALSDDELVARLAVILCRMESPLAWRPLLQLRHDKGSESRDWFKAVRHFRRVPEPTDLPAPRSIDEKFRLAQLRAEQRRFAIALELANEILKTAPTDAATMLLRSKIEYELSDNPDHIDRARAAVDELLAVHPDHARALIWKSHLLRFTRSSSANWPETVAQMLALAERAVVCAPSDWRVLLHHAEFLSSGTAESPDKPRDGERAMATLDRVISLKPFLPDGYRRRAALFAFLDKRAEAMADINTAIDLDPDNPELWQDRARLHQLNGAYSAAARDFTQAIELRPDAVWGYAGRASARQDGKDYAGALSDANALIADHGDSFPPAFYLRATIRKDMGDRDGAIRDLKYYVNLRPDFRDAEEVRAMIKEWENEK